MYRIHSYKLVILSRISYYFNNNYAFYNVKEASYHSNTF